MGVLGGARASSTCGSGGVFVLNDFRNVQTLVTRPVAPCYSFTQHIHCRPLRCAVCSDSNTQRCFNTVNSKLVTCVCTSSCTYLHNRTTPTCIASGNCGRPKLEKPYAEAWAGWIISGSHRKPAFSDILRIADKLPTVCAALQSQSVVMEEYQRGSGPIGSAMVWYSTLPWPRQLMI